MVHQFQHDANSFYIESKSAFFQDSPVEIDGPCQKIFFNTKILIEVSKQLQIKQIENKQDLLTHHL